MESHADPRHGSTGTLRWDPAAIPAATVVVLRDGAGGPEVLMLRRDRGLSFAGGMWVFPGGRIDPGDHPPDRHDLEAAATAAAVREAAEEAGLSLEASSLRRWSHWTPPPESPKRFSTAFFIAGLPHDAGQVVIDDGEIREHRWSRPAEVLEQREAGEVGLSPPTFITLWQLLPHRDVRAAMAHAATIAEPEHFATRICIDGDEVVALYHGDSGYEHGIADQRGPRHRLRMGRTWHYERTP